jgi:hypothetical protein
MTTFLRFVIFMIQKLLQPCVVASAHGRKPEVLSAHAQWLFRVYKHQLLIKKADGAANGACRWCAMAAAGHEPSLPFGDGMAASNLLLPFGFAVSQVSSSAEDYIQDGKNPGYVPYFPYFPDRRKSLQIDDAPRREHWQVSV